jgi:hypothetical protein
MSDTLTIPAQGCYSGGQRRDPGDRPLFDDYEPYTGEVYARVADLTDVIWINSNRSERQFPF